MTYRIGTVSPSTDEDAMNVLADQGVLFLYPRYRKVIRVGRERKKAETTVAVLPGLMFIHETQADEAVKALNDRGLSIWWLKNYAMGQDYARCEYGEAEPLLRWAVDMDLQYVRRQRMADASTSTAPAPTQPLPGPAPEPVRPRIAPGTMVTIGVGPFAGIKAVVTADDGVMAKVDLAPGRISIAISSCSLTLD